MTIVLFQSFLMFSTSENFSIECVFFPFVLVHFGQRTTSSSSLGSSDGNPVELKRANSGSLIDFNINSDPPVSSTQHVPQQTVSPLASSENWASFDVVPQQKASQTSANASSIQSSLDQLLVPAIAPTGNMPSPPVSGVHALSGNNDTRQIPVMPQNQADFFAAGNTRSALPPSDISMVNSLVGNFFCFLSMKCFDIRFPYDVVIYIPL